MSSTVCGLTSGKETGTTRLNLGSTVSPLSWMPEFISLRTKRRTVKLTAHIPLVPSIRMSGVIPLFSPYTFQLQTADGGSCKLIHIYFHNCIWNIPICKSAVWVKWFLNINYIAHMWSNHLCIRVTIELLSPIFIRCSEWTEKSVFYPQVLNVLRYNSMLIVIQKKTYW